MKRKLLIGAMVGFAAGAAMAVVGKIAIDKIVAEIKSETVEECFKSPEEDHFVSVSYGSSKTAKGLAFLRVKATTAEGEKVCKLSLLARKKPETLDAVWIDNNRFRLLLGSGKLKQCCDVRFENDGMTAVYSLTR